MDEGLPMSSTVRGADGLASAANGDGKSEGRKVRCCRRGSQMFARGCRWSACADDMKLVRPCDSRTALLSLMPCDARHFDPKPKPYPKP